MVLGETCKMAATSADRRKLAVLGAGRADWLCIGTSLDALGAGGASPPPAPTLQNLVLAPCADLNGVMAPSACERSQMAMLDGGQNDPNVCTTEDAGEPGRISTPPGALLRAPLVSSRSHPRGSLLGTSRPKEIGHPSCAT